MGKTNLSPEEYQKLVECFNSQTDVPEDLLVKLSPGFFEKLRQAGKFDYKELDKYKIPTIEYSGKRPQSVILAQAAITGGAAPLQIVRSFANGKNGDWKNLIVQGDNLQFLKTCYMNQDPLIKDKVKGKVKLIYIDPPFGTGDEYGGRGGQNSYSAKLAGSEFIEGIRERGIYLKEILSNDGIFFIRIDHHFGHYVKVVLDELFGKNSFQGEIVINRIKKNVTQQGRQSLPTANDSLFVYFKSEKSHFFSVFKKLSEEKSGYWRAMDSAGVRSNPKRVIEGQTFSPPSGRHFTFNQKRVEELYSVGKIRLNPNTNRPEYWVDPKDEVALDTNWTDISGYTFTTGYPTENSELLLERVISMTTEKGDIVMDVFGGSGTTAAVAEKLGRRWITCDFGKHAIYTMQKRILNISESKKLDNGEKVTQYGQLPKPFCVVSAGAYDFSRIMDLRKNKDTYVAFVLGLFGIIIDKTDYAKKYKLANIFAEKDGNPVEVYPVWDDEYLKDVRIDEDYLKDIIRATGGKLKGDYCIITPETCTNIGDTTMKNSSNEKVNFKLLKFPYKVLEDISRQFQIEEQASSAADINTLISSAGFYFNEEVKVEVEKVKGGLKITKFKTNILAKNKERYKGLDGLAMLLVDTDYDGKIFDMDTAIYSKELAEDGVVKIEGLTKDSRLIAVDKHGNESKITTIR